MLVAAVSLAMGVAGLALTSGADTVGATPATPLALVPCHLERLPEEVLCGTHEVFENRGTNSGRRLKIQFAVLEPLRRASAPDPLFILAGGPGQGARSFGLLATRFFQKVRRTRAIVLVDLRGTGASHPLGCAIGEDALLSLDSALGGEEMAQACLDTLDADPRHYTHTDALRDLDEIRELLGYQRINLWGGSWGTRAALLYAASYPDAVRSLVLDGAVPLDMEFPRSAARDSERALDLLLDACSRDPECASAYPDARGDFDRLLDRIERQALTVSAPHPQTGAPITVTLGRAALAEIVRVALYSPEDASRLLRILHHAGRGNLGPLLAQVVRSASASTDDMALGTTLSILCWEDMPLVQGADFDGEGRGTFARSGYADAWRTRCKPWPVGPALEADPGLRLQIPALILSGYHDPVTPPRWGEAMRRHFPNSLHVVVPGAAHNASFSGCVPDLIAAFIDQGRGDGIDPSCAQRVAWPPFAISDAGSRP
jgi:pimeloyl-ACP methyl ester carboxylesterase